MVTDYRGHCQTLLPVPALISIDVINVEMKIKKNVKKRKRCGENKKKFVNVG